MTMTCPEPATRAASAAALREILSAGGRVVPDWYGNAQLAEILNRFASAGGLGGQFLIVDAPLSALAHEATGWNAMSLPDGTLVFNFDLLNGSWSAAAGYVRRCADPGFDLEGHFASIVDTLARRGRVMPEAAPAGPASGWVSWAFRDMMAFVAGHEYAHFARRHVEIALAARRASGGDPLAAARLSRAQEFDADLVAMDLLVGSGVFGPRGALVTLAFMDAMERSLGRTPEADDTHPMAADRLARVRRWLAERRIPAAL